MSLQRIQRLFSPKYFSEPTNSESLSFYWYHERNKDLKVYEVSLEDDELKVFQFFNKKTHIK